MPPTCPYPSWEAPHCAMRLALQAAHSNTIMAIFNEAETMNISRQLHAAPGII